ncbi:MAG: hypothetical protein JNL67_08940 [Planctomycetaceae bacterium]|nr:hypothetical protein [Planctomycetaceae bacterium]
MLYDVSRQVAINSRKLDDERLRGILEANQFGSFVCIEPVSGDYYVGATFDDAVNQAIDAHPDRLTHTLRIGHSVAIHLGGLIQGTGSSLANYEP